MFKILKETLGRFTIIKLYNERTEEFVAVNLDFGASIHQIKLKNGDDVVEILDTYTSEKNLISEFPETYKGAKLFPFPNMVNKGNYSFEGINYQLVCNWEEDGHAIHGFVADKAFQVENETVEEKLVCLEVSYQYNGDLIGYPFSFRIKIEYTFTIHSEFICKTKIENTGEKNMPLADGWHPYFNLSTPIDELYLKVPSENIVEIDEKFIPTGKIISSKTYREFNFIGDTHFDTCYKLDASTSRAVTQLVDKRKRNKISIWQETGLRKYNYVVIYTPPSRKSIAIEPMTAQPDAFNNQQGLIILKPGEVSDASFGIEIHKYEIAMSGTSQKG